MEQINYVEKCLITRKKWNHLFHFPRFVFLSFFFVFSVRKKRRKSVITYLNIIIRLMKLHNWIKYLCEKRKKNWLWFFCRICWSYKKKAVWSQKVKIIELWKTKEYKKREQSEASNFKRIFVGLASCFFWKINGISKQFIQM